jgi:aspartate/glutamate racemase
MINSSKLRSLGIIGGLGIGATIHYYKMITDICRARNFIPRIYIDVAPETLSIRRLTQFFKGGFSVQN